VVVAATICLIINPGHALTSDEAKSGEAVDVTKPDRALVTDPVIPNDRAQAEANVSRFKAILGNASEGTRLHFPAGDYYLHGSALPNRGSLETTAPGQVFYGDGPQVTRLIQTDPRCDFGFTSATDQKRVPAATVRIRHKGCQVRDLSIVLDPELPADRVYPTAALQIAHIRYFPDNQIGIVETTGSGPDFLVDHVLVDDVMIGENAGAGIQAERFFEVGIDIVGSGGHVRVLNVHRLDARIGIRLDNGNHCGQGEYWFENCHMVGKPGVTGGGGFFDWVGGQAPMIFHCSAAFTNGLHAGPLGLDGDRFEPCAEGLVVRRNGSSWDWLTWHDHAVPDSPTPAERTAWYGLPRFAEIVRIGDEPRSGGIDYREGDDYRIERVITSGELEGATRIHWIGKAPAPGSTYAVAFRNPKEYRPHDLEWGVLDNASLQEAQQADPEGFVVKFHDQGVGSKNPDFHFPVGFGFAIRHNFTLTGDLLFQGDVGVLQVQDNVFGTGTTHIRGSEAKFPVARMEFSGNFLVQAEIEGYVRDLTFQDNQFLDAVTVLAPELGENIRFLDNHFRFEGDPKDRTTTHALALIGAGINGFAVERNHVTNPFGDGIKLKSASNGLISDNVVSGCGGAGIVLDGCEGVAVRGNQAMRNGEGIRVAASDPDSPGGDLMIQGNTVRLNDGTAIGFPYLSGKPYPRILLDGNLLSDEKGNPVEVRLPEDSISISP